MERSRVQPIARIVRLYPGTPLFARAGLLLALAVTAALYWPGLGGAFLLDDYQNLKLLENIKDPLTLEQVRAYLRSALSGPIGRTLPLITFAFQHQAWPADPWSFKLVNLLIHLANGCLLFWFFFRVSILLGTSGSRARIVSLFASVAWLLHPLHVSTTLYVVQRMTQLAALFTLAGLLAYVYGREICSRQPRRGYLWMSGGIVLGGILATLSKESGVLILVYVWVMEQTLFRPLAKPRLYQAWKAAFLHAPLFLLAAYFALVFQSSTLPGYAFRDFSLAERLLTEARVLGDYLRMLVLPKPSSLGLFHDDYVVSRGLFDPPGTAASVLLVVGLIVAAMSMRSRSPLFSFAVLWFFGGHILESSVIPLELYFEHRNYLPIGGILFSLAYGGSDAWRLCGKSMIRYLMPAGFIVWLFILAFITRGETVLWGDPLAQAAAWASERPQSIRAQERVGNVWAMAGDYEKAASVFAWLATGPLAYPAAYILWSRVGCYDTRIALPDFIRARNAIERTPFSKAPVAALEQLVISRERRECDRIGHENLVVLFQGLLRNRAMSPEQSEQVYGLLGRLQAADGQVNDAIASWDRAYAMAPRVLTAVLQARLLAVHGELDRALQYAAKARSANRPGVGGGVPQAELDRLEAEILQRKSGGG